MLQLFLTLCHLEAKALIIMTVVAPFCFCYMKHLFAAPLKPWVCGEKGKNREKTLGNWTSAGVCTPWALSAGLDELAKPSQAPLLNILAQLPQFTLLPLFFYSLFYHAYFLYSNSENSFRQRKGIFTCSHALLCEIKPEHQRSRISCSASEFCSTSKN